MIRFLVFFLAIILQLQSSVLSCSFFSSDHNSAKATSSNILSRRDWWKWPVGITAGVAYGSLVKETFSRISRGIVYPPEHEQRIESVIDTCLRQSAISAASQQQQLPQQQGKLMTGSDNDKTTLRILEVGIGVDARLLRRNLYQRGLKSIAQDGWIQRVELTGIDLHPLTSEAQRDVQQQVMQQISAETGLTVSFQSIVGDAVANIPFGDEYFDVVLCCLTLCSVTKPMEALQEMKRVLRRNGGTFGYIEHVAVEPNEPYRFLEWQQERLDPLQQLLADNCHLHRYTEASINEVFGVGGGEDQQESQLLQHERFMVKDMWPTNCQTSGVVQRIIA